MSWCKTRVLEHSDKFVTQVRWLLIPYWFEIMSIEREQIEYDDAADEEDERRKETSRWVAKQHATKYNGTYEGHVYFKTRKQRFNRWLLKHFAGMQGMQGAPGAPGCTGPMGMMGPAYDDIECPHCEVRRSQIHPRVPLHFDHFGEDTPLVYTCHFFKCGRQSNWIAYNGIFLNVGTITTHDPSEYTKAIITDRTAP